MAVSHPLAQLELVYLSNSLKLKTADAQFTASFLATAFGFPGVRNVNLSRYGRLEMHADNALKKQNGWCSCRMVAAS